MDKLTTDQIKTTIEKYYPKGELSTWQNKDFVNLSFEIQQKTKVSISSSTLKRIFGKRKTGENYTPQQATMEALVLFATILSQDEAPEQEVPKHEVSEKEESELPFVRKSNWFWFLGIAVVMLGSAMFFFFGNNSPQKIFSSASITLDKLEGKGAATAFFSLDLPGKDEYRIAFDDFSDTSMVLGTEKRIAHFYNYPGVFYPNVLHKGKKIYSYSHVMVQTDGWYALGTHMDMRKDKTVLPIPIELLRKEPGYLHASMKDYLKCGVDTNAMVVLRLYNFRKYGIDGDNFTLNLKVRNAGFWPGMQCNNIIVMVKGEHGRIQQYYPKAGCSFWIEGIYSDKTISGHSQDMSAFSVNNDEWAVLNITNQERKLIFRINDEFIFTTDYDRPLGQILGIEIRFYGTGYLDDFSLKSLDGDVIYEDTFDE